MKKTKIVCTLGPASNNEKTLTEMIVHGMNVARVNFSHGTHEGHGATIDLYRKVRDRLGAPGAVILDTKGPEIRTGDFKNGGACLEAGKYFILTSRDVLGDENIATITYKNLPGELTKGDTVLIDDGKIRLKVSDVAGDDIKCRVITGGKVSNHKGINIPAVHLNMEYLSSQDKSDLLFGIEKKVDYVAASFVRRADDVRMLRSFLDENGGSDIRIISKIENQEGIKNFEQILELSDGIMVARGDMGVEVEYEKLPGIQKKIIRRCCQSGKIAITATQMLESMISSPVPTRAEITDVANAVFDGTSAVMLSGETAMGQYPIQAVQAMARIAEQAENDDPRFVRIGESWHEMDFEDVTNAVGHAACTLAKDIHAASIVAITKTGYTASRMSKFRPRTGIIAATSQWATYNRLALEWGVYPIYVENTHELEPLFEKCTGEAVRRELLKPGDKVVISAGLPLGVAGSTNMVRVEIVK